MGMQFIHIQWILHLIITFLRVIDIVTFNPQADVFVYIDMYGILNTGHGHWFQIEGPGSLS